MSLLAALLLAAAAGAWAEDAQGVLTAEPWKLDTIRAPSTMMTLEQTGTVRQLYSGITSAPAASATAMSL